MSVEGIDAPQPEILDNEEDQEIYDMKNYPRKLLQDMASNNIHRDDDLVIKSLESNK